eukprot:TRINITY_DN37079_c0_g1_i3.p2 TRINITY_DN37079_c0_g1~~TRINITY_DN37079_c0_g1_i3.p2  ORF type:complete len:154 (+),score=42.62 TRINITY_DN37079_c0_g1_i3:57-518(+)
MLFADNLCVVQGIRFLVFFFFKQKTAYEMLRSLVGSEMCIRDRIVDSGDAAIVVNYEAIVFKLFNDEYVDVIVTEVTAEGFHGRVGPANVLTPTIHMPRFKFDQHGPVMQFVDMEGGATIRDGVVVRVRIVSETPGRDIDAMASMDGQFLCVR